MSVIVDVVEHGGDENAEHLLPTRSHHQLRQDESTDSFEARVLDHESRSTGVRRERVHNLQWSLPFVANPRVAQHRGLAHLEHLAFNESAPAALRLCNELEPRADNGGEA